MNAILSFLQITGIVIASFLISLSFFGLPGWHSVVALAVGIYILREVVVLEDYRRK